MRALLLTILLLSLRNLYSQTPIGTPFITTNPNEWLGWDVDISENGSVIAISSIAYPDYDSPDGLVKLFRQVEGEWKQIGTDIKVEAAKNSFGYAISLSENGNRLAIGAPGHDMPYGGCGAVFIYDLTTNEIINTSIIEGTASYQGIGFSLDLSPDGNTLVVGSQNPEYAMVQVYEEQAGEWYLKGEPIKSKAYGDKFGYQVMINSAGNRVAAIAISLGVLKGELPNIRVFDFIDGEWQAGYEPISSPDFDNRVQYFSLSNSGGLIAAKKKNTEYGTITFHDLQDNELEQSPSSITGRLDFNLILESNRISLAKDGQIIAVESSSTIKVFHYNATEWVESSTTITTDKTIQNMKLSENGEMLIVSFSGIGFTEREVAVYHIKTALNGNE